MNVIQQKVNNCHDDIFILFQMILYLYIKKKKTMEEFT